MIDLSFGKERRIRKRRDFDEVYRKGRRIRNGFLTAICLWKGEGPSRLGISVSGKVKGSVVRNRVRRLIREAFRLNREVIGEGWDVVISAFPGVEDADFWEIQDRVMGLLRRAGVIR
jgi:ribonuclease P protein component